MRLSLTIAAGLLTLLSPVLGHCSAVTFNFFDAAFTNGDTLTGTIVIDPVSGLFGNVDATVTAGAQNYVFDEANTAGTLSFIPAPQTYTYYYDAGGDLLLLDLPALSLVGYTGGTICSFDNLCADVGYFTAADGTTGDFESGSLVPAVIGPVPEPGSVALLGTGLLVFGGMARRRFIRD